MKVPSVTGLRILIALLVLECGAADATISDGSPHKTWDEEASVQEQTLEGLMGIADGVSVMCRYDQASKVTPMGTEGEQILAGASCVNRNGWNRSRFCKYAKIAGEVGSDALAVIQENQLPYDEYYTLLQIVEAEATGCDIKGKMMIANVVLNRVKDERFPDTIREVVWQNENGYAQFSPTVDGRISECEITQSTIDAVNRALDGEDNSCGALFFAARAYADTESMEWFDSSLKRLYEYGGHEFYTFKEGYDS